MYARCLSYNNTGAYSDGFLVNVSACIMNCTAYGNGRYGFQFPNDSGDFVVNCIAEFNGTFGFSSGGGSWSSSMLLNNADYNNASGGYDIGLLIRKVGAITGTGSFFVNAAGSDFRLNNNAGCGALLRGLSVPSIFTDAALLTSSYPDIGAAQSQAVAGGSNFFLIDG